jgi:hypothetical protein
MSDKQDSNLSSPQESNTTKHINFAETEENTSTSTSSSSNTDESPAKKEWEEMREENNKDQ